MKTLKNKRITVWLLVLVFALTACQSQSTPVPVPVSHRIEGQVELTRPTPANLPEHSAKEEPNTAELSSSPEITATLPITTGVPLTSTFALPGALVITQTAVITETPQPMTVWVYSETQVIRNGVIDQIAWAPETPIFAVGTSLGGFLISADTLQEMHALNVGERVSSVVFSPNRDLLVTGGLKGDIQWWNPVSGSSLATMDSHRLGISDLVFPSSGDYLVSGSDDGTVRLWVTTNVMNQDRTEHPIVFEWTMVDRVTCVDINSNQQLVAGGSYKTVLVWDLTTGGTRQSIKNLANWVTDLDFSQDGLQLAIADSSNWVRVLDTRTWEQIHVYVGEDIDLLSALAFTPDGNYLALGGENGKVMLWSLTDDSVIDLENQSSEAVTDLAFNPDGDILLASYQNGLVGLWTFQP